MNHPTYRRVEFAANVATILLAVVFSVLLANSLIRSSKPSQPAPFATLERGMKVSVPGVNWSGHQRNLILVLQKGCHFCSDSAQFYQELARTIGDRKDVQLIAALPQDEATSTEYLKSLGIKVGAIRQVDLPSIGIRATPTVLLTDSTGIVTDVWIGKLPPEKEQEVYRHL